MQINTIAKSLMFLLSIVFITSCDENAEPQTQFGIFKVVDDNTIEMDGEIFSRTLDDFNELIAAYPDINLINIVECPGSNDDEINVQVAKKVYDNDIATHLLDDGLIASGGVDFFLAGTTRTRGTNTMVGVHSWTDGENEATDFPADAEEHQLFIEFYKSIGFTQTAAEDFYFFTINAAPAAEIYYMTEAEIEQYGIDKP